jgi:hypothetical protein
MITEPSTRIDLDEPRSLAQIVAEALRLYWRNPVLFLVLALVVIAPYELIVLASTGNSPFAETHGSLSTVLTLTLIDFALIGPFISAMHVGAVAEIGAGGTPRLTGVVRTGLTVLPVVAAAEIMAGIAIAIGFAVLIFPGLVLAIRWAVVAQAAAVEKTDWIGALRRSGELTRGSYMRVFGLLLLTSVISYALILGGVAAVGTQAHVGEVVLGIVVQTISRSFAALTTAILYFDLRARENHGPRV